MIKKTSRGFTLIELLVVIAIIGILAGVVITNVGSTRTKARVAAAQATMDGIKTAAAICINNPTPAAPNTPTNTNNGGGGLICTGEAATYGSLPSGWLYGPQATVSGNTATTAVAVNVSTSAFWITAYGDNKAIGCTESSCTLY